MNKKAETKHKDRYFRDVATAICRDVLDGPSLVAPSACEACGRRVGSDRTVGYLVARVQAAFPHRSLSDFLEVIEPIVEARLAEPKGEADE